MAEKKLNTEEMTMLDEDKIIELIEAGKFEVKEYVTEQQNYDEIRDAVLKLIDEGKIHQKFSADKKMILEVAN